MNTNEVLKLALEALEYIYEGANKQGPHTGISWRCVSKKAEPVIIALREALNAPLAEQKSGIKQVIELYDSPEKPAQQEPVECKTLCELCVKRSYHFCANSAQTTLIPSPPAQRTWVGLTDEEITEEMPVTGHRPITSFARAIEAKLKEKNT